MAITAADVKALREKTGAGPMECKNALTQCNGDAAAAEKLLKEKGLAAAEKRSDRATSQGLITVKKNDSACVLVETDTETDFVVRNPEFIKLGEELAGRALEKGITEPDDELNGMVKDLATKIRENMALKRIRLIKAGANEYIDTYIHSGGALGVALVVSSDRPEIFKNEEVRTFVHDICLHIAAYAPLAVSKDGINAQAVNEQREIFKKQMEGDEKLKGKPEKVLGGILAGKVNKWLAEICLLDQSFVKNDKLTVEQAIAECAKKAGASLKIRSYTYLKVGEAA